MLNEFLFVTVVIIFIMSPVFMFIGLIKPEKVLIGNNISRIKVVKIYTFSTVISFFAFIALLPPSNNNGTVSDNAGSTDDKPSEESVKATSADVKIVKSESKQSHELNSKSLLPAATSSGSVGVIYKCKTKDEKLVFTNIEKSPLCDTIIKKSYFNTGEKAIDKKLKDYLEKTKLSNIVSVYSDNEVAGDELILDKKIDFTSTVSNIVSIKKTAYVFGFQVNFNQPVVILNAPVLSTIAAMAIMDDGYKKDIIKIRKNDHIFLSCIGVGLDKSGQLPFDIDDPLSLLTKSKILIFRDCRLKSSYRLSENGDDIVWKWKKYNL